MAPDLPKLLRVRQSFPDDGLDDPRGTARDAAVALLAESPLQPGQSVAITGSSRGIANIAEIIAGVVDALAAAGGKPFIVPAMGSHGGGTADRQAAVLHHYGVTEDGVGAPVRSSIEVVHLGQTPEGIPLTLDRHAAEADHIFLVNRIKPHTHLVGPCESGLAKIMCIGLGKPAGARRYHKAFARYGIGHVFQSAVPALLDRRSFLGGLAIVENARDDTARIEPIPAADILDREPALLEEAKRRMARLPFDNLDVLIIDHLGKDISGTGMDTNVIGRDRPGGPDVGVILVRDLTPASEGNASGIGMADITVRRLIEKMDAAATFLNCATALHPHLARVPYAFETDREALAAAIDCSPALSPAAARIAWIRSTMALTEIECSAPLADEADAHPLCEAAGPPHPFAFTDTGALVDAFDPPLD
jgi:hypothetical protein